MTENNDIDRFRQLFQKEVEPTKKVLVEFYKADFNKIKKYKEDMDLSWRDFFRAISMWMDGLQKNPEAQELIKKMVQSHGGKKS